MAAKVLIFSYPSECSQVLCTLGSYTSHGEVEATLTIVVQDTVCWVPQDVKAGHVGLELRV